MSKADHMPSQVAEMTDLQLLTYLLTLAGSKEEPARATAHTLLNTYDDLASVIFLPRSTLLNDPRLDHNAGAFLALVGAMSFRYANRFHRSSTVVMDAETVSRLLAPHLQGYDVERVCVICVDQDMHLLGSGAIVTQGDTDNVSFPIGQILSLALSSDAYGMILAHNHPDGAARFSAADLMTTDVLRQKLAVLGISLLDHYIWIADHVVSLYEQLHAPIPTPPLDRWDISAMPLLSRLDPKTSHTGQGRRPRRKRSPFFIDGQGQWPPDL